MRKEVDVVKSIFIWQWTRKDLMVDDSGNEVKIPQHYRKAEKRLKRLQRSLPHKKKGSKRRQKAIKRIAKVHLKVANQRKDFHYKTVTKLLQQNKHVAYEKLNIKGIARTRMAKSILDAGWGQFLQILSIKAERAGLLAIAVNRFCLERQSASFCSHISKELLN